MRMERTGHAPSKALLDVQIYGEATAVVLYLCADNDDNDNNYDNYDNDDNDDKK